MSSYTLLEYKLRRYIYLGNEYSIYIPPSVRTSYCKKKHQDDITGVRMIGKIVKKNKPEQINSIVPIILKIKKEDKLHDDRLLIFILAVCARFNLDQCKKMITDAYAAISFICTDGLKLLMFVKFCKEVRSILQTEGYLPNKSSSFGNDFRKAISNWYFSNDSLQTTEMIVRHQSYYGWTHKDVMKLIHIHSEDPTRQIFIIYTMCGMARVEKEFESKLKNIKIDNKSESYENKQLTFIYNFLKQVHNLQKMDDNKLKNEIELNRWGHMLEVIPRHKLKNVNILTSLVKHMPLKILLENTFYFAKQRLFHNSTPDVGLWEYIFRFNNLVQLQKSRIHPIESYIEYVKYSRTSQNILTVQNNILKKQNDSGIDKLPDNKFVLFIETTKKINIKNDNFSQTTNKTSIMSSKQEHNTTALPATNESKIKDSKLKSHLNESIHKSTKCEPTKSKNDQILNETEVIEKQNQITDSLKKLSLKTKIQENNLEKTVTDKIQSEIVDVNQNPTNIVLMTPTPKLVMQLMTFLSEDLIKKTLENLKPSGRRIIIVYDGRLCMKRKKCVCTHLLNVDEAITLLTLSLIYPDKLPNKPTIHALKGPDKQYKNEIVIDYNQPLTFAYLQSILFEEHFDNLESEHKDIDSDIYPLSIMDWARQHNKEYDVFVFLGTNKMNLKNAAKYIKEYRAFLKKPIKVVICCLNGKHTDQISLGRGNMLFVVGFDKNIGKIIDSFINAEF